MSTATTKNHNTEKTVSTANKSRAQTSQHSTYCTIGPDQTPFISPEFAFSSVAGIQMLQRTIGNRAINRFIQTKLTVGKPGDKYEQEADQVASQVMKMPAPVVLRSSGNDKEEKIQKLPIADQITPVVHRQSLNEEKVQAATTVMCQSIEEDKEEKLQTSENIQLQADEEETLQKRSIVQLQNEEEKIQASQSALRTPDDKEELQRSDLFMQSETIQRRESADNSSVSQHQEQSIQSSKGSGTPLSPNTRQFFENRFSADFTGVRVHTDSQASGLSQGLNAQAFTVGNDIYFNKGKYDTGSSAGKNLLAHELTHTVQQGASSGTIQNLDNVIHREVSGPQPAAPASSTQTAAGPSSAQSSGPGQSSAGGQSSVPTSQSVSSPSSSASSSSPVAEAGEISGSAQKQSQAPEITAASGTASSSAGSVSGGDGAVRGGSPLPASGASDSLLLPEYRSVITDEEQSRLLDVEERSSATATQTEELPSAGETVAEAQQAVVEPEAETAARAQGDIIDALDHREPPSPEIEEICQRIREVIRSRRPPDEDSLVDADPQQMAREAGSELDSSIQGDTQRVQGEYDSVNQTPEGQPSQTPEEPETQPESVETTDINATAATPNAPVDENVDLSADVEANRSRVSDAGMNSEPAQLVQDGPIAEAREAQGELEQMAERDPAEVLAETIEARANAAQNMAELQQRAMEALASSRVDTVNNRATEQQRTSETEEQIRQRIGSEAQQIVNTTREQVNSLLEPLSRTAMERWNSGKEVLATRFSQTLAEVKRWIDERHSGVEGFVVGIGDAIFGLPDWVTETYDRAEREFGDGVCDLIRDISSEVNGVIASAQALIADSRDRISRIFTNNLPESLQSWAAEQQAQFDGQLNELHQSTEQTRENLNHQLADQAAQSVQDARTQIHELRVAAGGIVGRIEDAVNRFLEDPVKFIIDGLLSLAGISPPAFWALVNRIQSVISDIADDPMNFANNLAAALGQGFSQFFDNFGTHVLNGFFEWLFSGLGSVGVQLPADFSLKSIITFCLQLMGITWPNIRQMLVRHIGEENIALIEQAVGLLSTLIEQGPEGIFEMIKERLDPQAILNQILEAAVSYLIETLITRISARIIMMFNPAGAIVQAIEVIYRIISWVFQNAARIFSLVETVINGAAQLIAGNISGMAGAVEGALARLIAPVIDFLAGFLGLGNLPDRIADTIRGFQQMVLGIIERVIDFLATRARGLLRSLGIGGEGENETQDETNGNIISEQLQMGDESHALKIKTDTNEVTLSSGEGPLDTKLNLGLTKLNEIGDNPEAENAKDAINRMKALLQQIFSELRKPDNQVDRSKLREFSRCTKEVLEDYGNEFKVDDVIDGLPEYGPVVVGPHPVGNVPQPDGSTRESHHVPPKELAQALSREMRGTVRVLRAIRKPASRAAANNLEARAQQIERNEDGTGLSAISLHRVTHQNAGGVAVHSAAMREEITQAIAAIDAASERETIIIKNRASNELAVNPSGETIDQWIRDVNAQLDRSDASEAERTHANEIIEKTRQNVAGNEQDAELDGAEAAHERLNRLILTAFQSSFTQGKAAVVRALGHSILDGPADERQTEVSKLDSEARNTWRSKDIIEQ